MWYSIGWFGDILFRRQDLNKDLKRVNWLCWQLGGEDSCRGNRESKGPQEEVSWCPCKVTRKPGAGLKQLVQAETGREQVREVIRGQIMSSFEGTVRTLAFILWETGSKCKNLHRAVT